MDFDSNAATSALTEPMGLPQQVYVAGEVVGGKYRLVSELGRGGMGVVWKAERASRRGDFAAIKMMAPNLQGFAVARKRFEREVDLAARVRSPHVVYVFDDGVDERTGELFIVMELLDGESLGRRLHRLNRLSPGEVMVLVKQMSRALTFIHKAGVVHRDLKPDNIFLTGSDEDPVFKILDFGLAKELEIENGDSVDLGLENRALTVDGNALGTRWYMSPEHLRGKPTEPRGDVWSLAIIAFECLVGCRPFDATDIATLGAQLLSADRPVPSQLGKVPAGFDAWFAKATHRDPERRFQTVKELELALHTVCGASPRDMPPIHFGGHEPGLAPTLAAVTRAPESGQFRRHRLRFDAGKVVTGVVAALAVGVGIEAYVFWPPWAPSVAPAAVIRPLVAEAPSTTLPARAGTPESAPTPVHEAPVAAPNPSATAGVTQAPRSDDSPAAVPALTQPPETETEVPSTPLTRPVRTSKKPRRASASSERPAPRPHEVDRSQPSIVEVEDGRSQPSIVETGYR